MRITAVAFVLLLLSGCGDKAEIPKNIIPAAKMKLVMYDMMKSGEFLSGYVLYKDVDVNKTGESMKWYNKVWEIHKISEADFRRSYEWYKNHPKVMSALMDSIMVIPAPPNPKPGPDSIVALPAADSIRRVDSINRSKMIKGRERMRDSIRRHKGLLVRPD
ncbi:MAG: DUF4296 domain-containing protein [Chitinophagaceae bacterium]|nr:MAG: DUF4296 domain-containing protein [Chitinophagaceae bacterium]